MTRDELERLAKFLDQGLVLDRETQKRLVLYALGTKPRNHLDGCAWWRGAGCSCAEENAALDLSVKDALSKGARCVWECADCHIAQEGYELEFECIRCHSGAGVIDRGAKPGNAR